MAHRSSRSSRLMDFARNVPVPGLNHRHRQDSVSFDPLRQPSSPRAQSPSGSYYNDYNSSDMSHGAPPMNVDYRDDALGSPLAPPNRPYSSGSPLGSRHSSSVSLNKDRPSSLSVNYVPAKFTKLHEPGKWQHRSQQKQGGGRDAFASDASRMGQVGTVDDDEGTVFQFGKGGLKQKKKPKLRWNRFKWALLIANILLLCYGMAALVSAILVWLNVFFHSDVIRVGNRTELILSTTAASMMVLTSLIGFSGILLNNRPFLAVYTFLLWVCLGLMVAPGYIAYKQRTFNLEGKINLQWSRLLGTDGRLRIQDALRCCGYTSPYIEASTSPLCYARSNLPGCKSHYLRIEREVLETWYTICFALVPAHIGVMITALLCSNHITYRFGKGLTPKQYRLDLSTMAVIMDEYASQIAAQYGDDVAAQALRRSSSYADPYEKDPSYAMSTAANPALTTAHSRGTSLLSTGYNSQSSLRPQSGVALYDRNRETWASGPGYSDLDDSSRQATTGGSVSEYDHQRDPRQYQQQPQPQQYQQQQHQGWAQ